MVLSARSTIILRIIPTIIILPESTPGPALFFQDFINLLRKERMVGAPIFQFTIVISLNIFMGSRIINVIFIYFTAHF